MAILTKYTFCPTIATVLPPVDLHWFLKISIRTEKKFQYKLTEILSQFEMNAEMEISKNQWRSTGG